MIPVRTSFGVGRYATAEGDALFGTLRGFKGQRPPLVWCHGNHGLAATDYTSYFRELSLLAQRYLVVTADLGGNTFGNDLGIERVEQAVEYLVNDLGAAGPVTLVGVSMGASVALNYAVRNAEACAAVACVIPALDFSVPGPGQVQLDAAYPPEYDDDDPDHRAHNPVRFAADIPTTLPVGLWTSSDDPAVPPFTADTFVAQRPATYRNVFGAYGHGGIPVAIPLVADWLVRR